MISSDIFKHPYHYFTFSSLFFIDLPSLFLNKAHPAFPFPPTYHLYPANLLSIALLPYLIPQQWPLFIFLVSAVAPGYVLTSDNLEMEASDAWEHGMFVFLGLSYFTQYDLFWFHPLPANFYDFIFLIAN